MMSSFSMQSGARARERKNDRGFSGLRTLIWPKESTTPSVARMRLAVTSSSKRSSSLDILQVPQAVVDVPSPLEERAWRSFSTSRMGEGVASQDRFAKKPPHPLVLLGSFLSP